VETVERLKLVYGRLDRKKAPNTDHLIHSKDNYVVLEPRGKDVKPRTYQELVDAVRCVLDALEVCHAEPPIFHQDLRWPNIMQDLDNPRKWFIIDWDDAASPPTQPATTLSPESHSPDAFKEGHNGEVDVWGVGHLLCSCSIPGVPLSTLGREIKEMKTVQEARAAFDSRFPDPGPTGP